MRGFDFRSADMQGIALYMCAQLGSNRDVKQALGRVGRYGDPGARHKLIDNLVNEDEQRRRTNAFIFRH